MAYTPPPTVGQTLWGDPLNDTIGDIASTAHVPQDYGYITWTGDPLGTASTSSTPSTNTPRLARVMVRRPQTITSVAYGVNAAGTSLGANCFLGVYDSSGTRVAVTASQTSQFGTATSNHVIPFTAPFAATTGFYFVAVVAEYTGTGPSFWGSSGGSFAAAGGPLNLNLPAGQPRSAFAPAPTAGLPASITLASYSLFNFCIWSALL